MSAIAERDGRKRGYPVKAGVVLASNTPAVLDAGFLTTVTDGGGSAKSAGVTSFGVDNNIGGNGDVTAEVVTGEHKFANSGDITNAHVGDLAYYVSDTSVSISHATNSRNVAGIITQVDSGGVWVETGV